MYDLPIQATVNSSLGVVQSVSQARSRWRSLRRDQDDSDYDLV